MLYIVLDSLGTTTTVGKFWFEWLPHGFYEERCFDSEDRHFDCEDCRFDHTKCLYDALHGFEYSVYSFLTVVPMYVWRQSNLMLLSQCLLLEKNLVVGSSIQSQLYVESRFRFCQFFGRVILMSGKRLIRDDNRGVTAEFAIHCWQ